MIDGDWLNRKEAARHLTRMGYPTTAKRLEHLACNNNAGNGPPFTRVGWRSVFYKVEDLDAWAIRAEKNKMIEKVS